MATTGRASIGSSANRSVLFPPGFGAFVRRRLREAAGIALIALALALVVALLGYQPGDPSLNTATTGPVQNLLGLPGALTADLLLQTLGLGSGLMALVIAAWGYRLAAGRGLANAWLRAALLPFGLLAGAVALATVTPPLGWPLVSGLGGFTGTLMLAKISAFLPMLGASVSLALVGLVAAFIATIVLIYVLGFSLREWWVLLRNTARMIWAGGRLTYRAAAAGGQIGGAA
ncbi:MAG: DNA translocase FtsK 4TM domain-containing protein, partial [Alphaproteobacteria bacterium]|nr:DNA translocase FtsK 4TM domain-containing protein [Alphaproteobacteria bacterium]